MPSIVGRRACSSKRAASGRGTVRCGAARCLSGLVQYNATGEVPRSGRQVLFGLRSAGQSLVSEWLERDENIQEERHLEQPDPPSSTLLFRLGRAVAGSLRACPEARPMDTVGTPAFPASQPSGQLDWASRLRSST